MARSVRGSRAGDANQCADASADRAHQQAPNSDSVESRMEAGSVVPRRPPTGPAAPGSRRIGAAAFGRRGLGPLAR
jgi:hypothetical protein